MREATPASSVSAHVDTKPTQETHAKPDDVDAEGLTPRELLFVEAYCGAANFVAIKAYEVAGYSMRGRNNSVYANAANVLRKPKVQDAIAVRLSARVERLRIMDGDEALERLSLYARSSIKALLDESDPLRQLPDDVLATVKAIRPGRYGRTLELYDALQATQLMAKAHGKLRDHVDHEHKFTLEDLVAGPEPTTETGAAA